MQSKKTVVFFSTLLLLSMLMCSVDASSDATVSFSGGGVTIDLTYPEEAHPNSTITHNITITAIATTTLQNFTTVIKASVNSSWVEIFSAQDTFSKLLPSSYNLTVPVPEEANGTLQCFIFVDTSSIDDLSTTLYTTLVSDPTFSEMRVLYDEMLANYTLLQEDYETLFNDYNELYVNYTSLVVNYTTLLNEYDQLVADHDTLLEDYDDLWANYVSLDEDHTALLSEYNQLTTDYDNQITKYNNLDEDYTVTTNELSKLQIDYDDLNDTRYDLQTSYITLNQTYHNLQQTFTELQRQLTDSQDAVNVGNIVMFIFVVTVVVLIVFIAYIKRKQEDPYLVIRKETVSMKSDEET
jgi:predicted nuclease with TOPRIM domain